MVPKKVRLNARKLPNVGKAWIPEEKLKDYVLNPDHPRGKHKARPFMSVLAIGQDDWKELHDQILARLPDYPVHHVRVAAPFGLEYEVRIIIDGLNGKRALVRTAWMVDASRTPRLTSAFLDLP